jgi:uncharacterized membrane protein YgdD (TMEM256/DUF423 family)
MWWSIGGVAGLLAVALGAFGAHGLEDVVTDEGMAWWQTAARYHLVHAVAIVLVALHPRRPFAAGVLFTAGIVLFSGSLYVMALTELRWLGAITPLGGLCLIGGWGTLAFWPRKP